MQCVLMKVAVHLDYGSGLYRYLWTSLLTPLVSAQRHSEHTVVQYNSDGYIKLLILVVTVCTTRLNIQKFYVLPTPCICFFLYIDLRTAIISVYNINCLVLITETLFVYCAVQTEYLTVI
jgi:hypothetical protein